MTTQEVINYNRNMYCKIATRLVVLSEVVDNQIVVSLNPVAGYSNLKCNLVSKNCTIITKEAGAGPLKTGGTVVNTLDSKPRGQWIKSPITTLCTYFGLGLCGLLDSRTALNTADLGSNIAAIHFLPEVNSEGFLNR